MSTPRPSMAKAIKAKCRNCMADHADGRRDCGIPSCSLYWWMPYGTLSRARRRCLAAFPTDETLDPSSGQG